MVERSLIDRRETNMGLCGYSGNTRGYSFYNPDTGTEWSREHPIESGQCDDATDIRPMRFSTWRRQFMERRA
ncbi:conserved protein of unknown function (plasmid) [Rhodovastum atsumiense]|uniref:Uncharacterized protein n=1 Tax=Rhodovastum atsumiense TaxID=504468 RepID=A0A5M6IMZ2_9PROT|nr:hypothetical protein [Rhodovastum atsumiense]KAA5609623.1 hypothetical protein F1189_22945 [Rhodovastum atsumiense]CAH2606484.1 conserved protein of unknown function [Rhodovastum atsumiense]